MNIEQAKLLARIGQNILKVDDRFIYPLVGLGGANLEETHGHMVACGAPIRGCGCLMNHAYRARLVPFSAWRSAYPEGFAELFGCSKDDGNRVIYHNHLRDRDSKQSTANNYYTAVKELLAKYGYAHLLEPEEVIPVREIKPAYKDHLTPAEKGFDWRNFAHQPQQTRADE